MIEDQEELSVNIDFLDIQIGAIPEPFSSFMGLITKAALGVFLTYFSLQELTVELKKYRTNLEKGESNATQGN